MGRTLALGEYRHMTGRSARAPGPSTLSEARRGERRWQPARVPAPERRSSVCDYCGCQEVLAIADLTAEHDRIVTLSGEARRALHAGALDLAC